MDNDLTKNMDKLHTTELGLMRMNRNLDVEISDAADWCRRMITQADDIFRKGKNWYICAGGSVVTVNANSYTIITAHKDKKAKGKDVRDD